MCTVLSVYFYIVVYTSTLLVFTLLWKSSPFPSEIPSLSLSPGLQRLARGFCHLSTTKHVSWILLWRLEKAARFVCIAAFRTDRRMDGWMDLWVSKRKLTPFYKFIYFCVYGIDRRELIRSNTGRLSTAGIYSETHCQPKGCCTTERLIKQASNYIHLWWCATLLYVQYTKGPTDIRKTPFFFWCFADRASQCNLSSWPT